MRCRMAESRNNLLMFVGLLLSCDKLAAAGGPEDCAIKKCSLRQLFEMIDKSADVWGSSESTPAATVRAVNHLHALGKEEAIGVLRRYLKYADAFGNALETDEPNQERLCVIIPLLFVPSVANGRVPSLSRTSPWFCGPDGELKLTMTDKWELDNLIVSHDLPFIREFGMITGAPLPDRDYLVDWAEKHGRLREKRLLPSDDPLKVADEICAAIKEKDEESTQMSRSRIRSQSWRSLRRLIPDLPQNTPEMDQYLFKDDEDWKALKVKASEMSITWSDEQQRYVSKGD